MFSRASPIAVKRTPFFYVYHTPSSYLHQAQTSRHTRSQNGQQYNLPTWMAFAKHLCCFVQRCVKFQEQNHSPFSLSLQTTKTSKAKAKVKRSFLWRQFREIYKGSVLISPSYGNKLMNARGAARADKIIRIKRCAIKWENLKVSANRNFIKLHILAIPFGTTIITPRMKGVRLVIEKLHRHAILGSIQLANWGKNVKHNLMELTSDIVTPRFILERVVT